MLKCSKRGDIASFLAMEVLTEANRLGRMGKDIIHLEAGEPAMGPPAAAIAAASATLDGRRHGYTTAMGMPVLRQGLATHYADYYGLPLEADRIAITAGASAGLVLALLAAFDAGDHVAFAEPGYPAYRNALQALGIETVPILTELETGFQPTPAHLDALDRPLDGLVIASPANPTGSMFKRDELEQLARYCDDNGIRLIADEIYHGITFGQPAETALHFTNDAIVINSFSKYYCMTGWRVGWMVLPTELIAPVSRLSANLYIAPSTISQQAALGALDARDELRSRIQTYHSNRDHLLETLREVGIERIAPAEGAFYLYADVSKFTDNSVAFCRQILDEVEIAMTPGIDFDQGRGHHYVRLSFAGAPDMIDAATRRLRAWFDRTERRRAA
ncbi:MAG: aminotransferase class I/II-fold pyridoxal phosphate-dependent enzyme [Pseudomonadota bacterium]